MADAAWWQGRAYGMSGCFPANFVWELRKELLQEVWTFHENQFRQKLLLKEFFLLYDKKNVLLILKSEKKIWKN